ncbi:conserved unknown protein [Ectocarpus siliculosus]|uniref:Uncharacterized protein n=1 Tax=Ectocarpus siliculosus TaxID=2880 RepID=D7FLG4_ECTSI|nr:conserved unknown protein [Ectocarpus siliculosus]|eukprot:CBJ25780.1 conserved unknown protein [Ectocarpus siliculosus]
MDTVDLKVVLPQAIKQLAFFLLARWLNKSLSPTVESQVRAARAIYTVYLIVSQALCMYIRYLIWKKGDDTEVEVPPPAQLKKLIQDAGKAGVTGNEGAPAATTGGAGGAASPLGPVMDKMMTSRMAVKKYDMKFIQGVRRRQFWASLMMCYTHLRRGMIKPMMFQVSFGVLSLLDNPLVHIYLLGREAKGNLARPFKKQGLMESLSGPMETMATKAAAEAQAAEAKAAEARSEEDKGSATAGVGEEEEEEEEEDDDGGEMPDIEILTNGDESDDVVEESG